MKVRNVSGKNVVSMTSRRARSIYGAVAQVEGYWQGLSGGHHIPSRADIDPRGLEDALEYAFILERIAPGVARFRIAGMHLADLMGMDVRGMPISAMFQPAARQRLSEILETVCQEPQIAMLTLKGDAGLGRPKIDAQMLLAPLCDETGQVTRMLGCLQSKGRIGRQPRRFSVQAADCRPIDASGDGGAAPSNAQGLTETPAAFTQKPDMQRPDENRPALRLVWSAG